MLELPVLVLVAALLTLAAVFLLSALLGNTHGLLLPLSLLSNQRPQYYVYASGLTIVSFAAALLLLRRHRPARVPATAAGLLACLCMLVQALVPLPEDFALVLAEPGYRPPATAAVHSGAAGLFFLLGTVHAALDYSGLPAGSPSRRGKGVCLATLLLVPTAQALHPTAVRLFALPLTGTHRLAFAAITQYIVVAGLIGYFACYHLEREPEKKKV